MDQLHFQKLVKLLLYSVSTYDHVNFPDFSILFLEGFEFQGQQLGLAMKTLKSLWPHQVKC